MKEIIFGMSVGIIIGCLLYKNCEPAKELIDKGENFIRKEMASKPKKTI